MDVPLTNQEIINTAVINNLKSALPKQYLPIGLHSVSLF